MNVFPLKKLHRSMATAMLEKKDWADIEPELRHFLDDAAVRVEHLGGVLCSRQAVSAIIACWQMNQGVRDALKLAGYPREDV